MYSKKSKDSNFIISPNLRMNSKDVEVQANLQQELEYPHWMSWQQLARWLLALPEDTLWNCFICIIALVAIVWVVVELKGPYVEILDSAYNIAYGVHVVILAFNTVGDIRGSVIWTATFVGFVIDAVSFLHYFLTIGPPNNFKMFCYYLRMHRPFKYLWALNEFNLKGSVLGTTLKYCYIFFVLRVTWALIWVHIDEFEREYMEVNYRRALYEMLVEQKQTIESMNSTGQFLNALFIVNKMFIPIGPSVAPANDMERIACLLVMLTGCLVVTGAAVASLSLVISIYMRPEEAFRARYRLIMKEMKQSNVPPSLREKVETFYKMYWHKQRAVSATHLLPTFPPTLPNTIYTDIYFAATQKSRVLRDLSYGFLSELAKKMQTVLYIPGDTIIKRSSRKSTIIYIAYGDIEMLSAEDDSTAILRMTRGTSVSGCAGGAPAGCAREHVDIRAATFCITHALPARDLWLVALKYSRHLHHTRVVLNAFYDHLESVKRHYSQKVPENVKYKSSILHFKRNLMALKEAKDADGNLMLRRSDVFLEIAGSYIMRNVNTHREEEQTSRCNHITKTTSRPSARPSGRQADDIYMQPYYPVYLAAVFNTAVVNGVMSVLLLQLADALQTVKAHGKRADASQTDEADAICLRPTFPCILQPSSSLQDAWQWFICCVIVTVCFTHPYYLVFKKNVPLDFRFFDYVVTVLYVLDLIVYLSTGANVEEGVPITFAQTSSQQMRSHWFVLDVVGTLPIFEFVHDGHFAGINKLLRLPKVFRVLKSLEEVCVYNSNVLRFLSYTLLLLIACYLIAALQQGFMCYQFRCCLVTNFTHSPFWENKELDEETVSHRLTFGLYWAISMITFTTHMETWGTENWNSTLYTMFVLEVCIVLHIFIEAVYSATIMVTTALREDYDSCIAKVKGFLIRNQVDPLLRQRFITYLQLCWYTDKAYSMTNKKSSIFYDLPPHVYQDIVTRQRSKYLLSIPFMKLLNKEDLKNVSSKAKLFYTSPNEILLNTGDISNEIYVIKQGMCEILSPDTKQVVETLGVKHYFGVIECLLRIPAFYTVRAVTHVQVFSISKKVLFKAMELPQIKDAIEFVKTRPEYARLQYRRESFLSYDAPARVPNTERFPLPRKYEVDYAFLMPFNRLGFFSILRYIFPRFTIRPDGAYLMRYEWFRTACALLAVAVFPSYTYLVLQWPSLYFLTLFLDFAAYFDIVQRMLVGYFNAQGVLVYHPASTAAHYLRGAFIVDLFACLPLENLESPYKDFFENNYRLTKSRQVLMLNRILQLYRLPSAMLNLERYIERRDILVVIKAIPLFMALLNVLTCLMVFHSVDIFQAADSGAWLIVPMADAGGSWINLFSKTFRFNFTETPWNLHLATHFWAVYETTTTGYNSFNPSNIELMELLFAGMLIGAMITTYFSVRIISTRANVNKELAAYQEHMKDIVVFMRRENLDKHLQKEVVDYYEYNWEKMGGVDYTTVLKLCDQITLRTDAILHLYGPTFEKECDLSLLRLIGRAVRSAHFLRDMQLVDVDDVIHNLYFVDYGVIGIKDNEVSTKVVKLTTGSVFGNLDNEATVLSKSAIVAYSRVHLLQIDAVAFHHIISDFPQVAKLMENCRPYKENYIMGSTDSNLLFKKDHVASSILLFRSRRGLVRHLYYKDRLVQLYFIVISLACVYTDLYNAGFQNNSASLIFVLYALDFGFCMKIILHYALPCLVDSKYFKKTLLPIRRRYFQREFKYDLISCLPTELLSFTFSENQWMAFSWLRLNRMFRIVTVYKCLKRHQERITVNLTLSTVFSVLVWFTLFVHTAACLWYFIGILQDKAKPYSSWMHNDVGGAWCHNLYICSVYFVLTTFTQNGVGDIMPKNQAEVLFVSILQIISTLVYMVYVGEFSNIIQFQSYRSFGFYCKYLQLQHFLKNNRVSKNLVSLVNRYSLHLWRETRGVQVPYFLSSAPQGLRLRVMTHAYMQHLTKNRVFAECEPTFLRQLVGCLQLYTYNEGMYVVKENEITDAMYMIHTGRVYETSAQTGMQRKYQALECFGLEQGLFYDKPYPYSYCSVIKSQVLTLRLSDWEYLLKHFPKSKQSIYDLFGGDDDSPDNTGDQPEVGNTDKKSDDNDRPPSDKKNFPGSGPKATVLLDYTTASNLHSPHPTAEIPSTKTGISPTTDDVPLLKPNLFDDRVIAVPSDLEQVEQRLSVSTNMGQSPEPLSAPSTTTITFPLVHVPYESSLSPPPISTEVDLHLNGLTFENIIEPKKSKSSSSKLSHTSSTSRRPQDLEEAAEHSSPTFLESIETKAKVNEISYERKSDESSEKDILLMEEDEEATSDLFQKLEKDAKKEQQPSDPTPDKTDVKSSQEQASMRIQEPLENNSYALVPFNPNKAIYIRVQEPSLTSRSKRSVHYKEDDLTFAADSEGQSKDIVSNTSSETEVSRPEDEAGPSREKDSPSKKKEKKSDDIYKD